MASIIEEEAAKVAEWTEENSVAPATVAAMREDFSINSRRLVECLSFEFRLVNGNPLSYQRSAVSYQLSAISFQLSAVSYQLSAVSYQ
ncbi:MAG TPA: hypothetical protein VGQ81_04205, partial [Acidobacteriota bacterium]|nr:hypothetical protein [Acidobacteriota bacterium]